MAKKTKSARGATVDFDLMDIKNQIKSTPKPIDVKKRENFIDEKLRRRLKKVTKKIEQEAAAVEVEAPVVEEVIEEPVALIEEKAAVVEEPTEEVVEETPKKKKRKVRKS